MVRGKGSMRDKKKVRFCYKITDIITELQFTMRAHRFVMFETIKTRSVVSNRAPAQHQAQHQARCGMVKKSPKQGGKGRGTSHLCWPPYCIISHGQHLASQPFPPDTTQYPHLKNVLSCCPTGQNTSDVLTMCSFEANCPDCSLLGDNREEDDEWVTSAPCAACMPGHLCATMLTSIHSEAIIWTYLSRPRPASQWPAAGARSARLQ